jgi:FMN phosphatase YigB (HAD superfamily)
LVDLESVQQTMWRGLFNGKYTNVLADECAARSDSAYRSLQALPKGTFLSLKSIFSKYFYDLVYSNSQFEITEAAKIWAHMHTLAKPFPDSKAFLSSVGNEYPICLATDADDDMLGANREMFAFDNIFTSEQCKSYKANGDGRFFSLIIDHYGAKSSEIMHVGDSKLEMVSAKKAGITTCWINRNGTPWLEERPDYEASP